jgi:hypothetical protein
MAPTRLRRALGGAAAAFTLLAVSACGGGGADGDDVASLGGDVNPLETEDTEPLDEDAQALVFAECMRDEGIDIADPGPDQEGLSAALHEAEESYDRETYDQALNACEELLTHRDHGSDDHAPDDEMMLDLAECLREQGLDVPDNLFEGGGMHDVEDDEVGAAMEECRDVAAGGEHG